MNPVQYIFINRGLGMSSGKIAAQAAHAAVESYRASLEAGNLDLLDTWVSGGHYTKIVLQADDSTQLLTIDRYLTDRGFKTSLIIDEGRTEIPPMSPTALGVEIVDKNDSHTKATFESFKLYKDDAKIFGDDAKPYMRFDRQMVPQSSEEIARFIAEYGGQIAKKMLK